MSENKWIPVTERLPSDGQEVLIFTPHQATEHIIRVETYFQENGWTQNVTHWQPLPEPPPKPDPFETWWNKHAGCFAAFTIERDGTYSLVYKAGAKAIWDAAIASTKGNS